MKFNTYNAVLERFPDSPNIVDLCSVLYGLETEVDFNLQQAKIKRDIVILAKNINITIDIENYESGKDWCYLFMKKSQLLQQLSRFNRCSLLSDSSHNHFRYCIDLAMAS